MAILSSILPLFLLVFCRLTAFFVVAPIFSSRTVPMQAKIGFCALLSIIIVSSTLTYAPTITIDNLFILDILKEVLIGLILGFVAYLIFTTFELAGAFIDLQMGLSFASVFDPSTGVNMPLTGRFKYIIATLLFLIFNGHHYLIQAIIESYNMIPLQTNVFATIASGKISSFLLVSFTTVFILALQMAAPIIVALFLTDLGLGILSKVAPQFNVFVVGMPLKIFIGFFMILATISGLGFLFEEVFKNLFVSLNNILHILKES